MPQPAIRLQQSNTELISDEVKEIISYRPHWMVRKGNIVFAVILLSLLALSWFISYPDVVTGAARLVAVNIPKPVRAKGEGKLVKLFVRNEQAVQKGQPLGYIESTAAYEQVVQLQSWIHQTVKATQNHQYDVLVTAPLPGLSDLGELQTAYQSFQNQLTETIQILSSGYYQKKRAALQKDLAYLSSLKSNAYQQQELLKQDQQLQQKEYTAYESLAKDKVIAPLELNQYKSKLLAKDQTLKQIGAQLTNSDIASHAKQKELLDLQKTVLDQQQKFHSSLLSMKSEVENWIQQYVFLAPEGGTVLFLQPLQEAEALSAGQELFYIQPPQTSIYAQLTVGQKGLGKVRKGQQVMLRLDSYPSEEFGYITGTVDYVSAMPNRKDSFWIKAHLPKGLQTSARQVIHFRNNLSAQAQIITDNRTLFDRLAGELKNLLKRS